MGKNIKQHQNKLSKSSESFLLNFELKLSQNEAVSWPSSTERKRLEQNPVWLHSCREAWAEPALPKPGPKHNTYSSLLNYSSRRPLHRLFNTTLSTLEFQLEMLLPINPIAKGYHVKETFHVQTQTHLHFLLGLPERERASNRTILYSNSRAEVASKWTLIKERISLISKAYILYNATETKFGENKNLSLSSRLWIYQSAIAN